MSEPLKILIAPLDWGLGHATRCIPIIEEFINQGAQVHVAGTQRTNTLIAEEFPNLNYFEINAYNIQYTKNKWMLPIVMLKQVPKIIKAIWKEYNLLKELVNQYHFDLIISDNRYGFYHKKVRSIFMTHQLQIHVPHSRIVQNIVNAINHAFIKRFSACWIPDYVENSLAGKLSICPKEILHQYLGILSRLKPHVTDTDSKLYSFDIVVLLSGPEPQRSILESILLTILSNQNQFTVLIVRGLPENGKEMESVNRMISRVGHANAKDLMRYLKFSDLIISRSGYSTIMDLVMLGKNALLIPTPGQTEQEYLATYLSEYANFVSALQEELTFSKIQSSKEDLLKKSSSYYDTSIFKKVISNELSRIAR